MASPQEKPEYMDPNDVDLGAIFMQGAVFPQGVNKPANVAFPEDMDLPDNHSPEEWAEDIRQWLQAPGVPVPPPGVPHQIVVRSDYQPTEQ